MHWRITACFLVIAGTALLYRNISTLVHAPVSSDSESLIPEKLDRQKTSRLPWDSSNFLRAAPTTNFRDNLRADVHYVTSWNDGGFTNEFISYVNLIHLGILSDRVTILPPFAPFHHISPSAGVLPFSEIFDLERLRRTLRQPVLEWSDVKQRGVAEREPLGCWSTWTTSDLHSDPQPRRSDPLTAHLSLDVSYTPVPPSTRRFPSDDARSWDWYLLFNPLSSLVYPRPEPPSSKVKEASFPSEQGHRLPPDEQLSCFDLMYFVSSGKDDFEWNDAWCPAWRFVGRHIRFQESLVDVATGYVQRLLQTTNDVPFISLHIRHGDFGNGCETTEGCFAPLSLYADRVADVKNEIYRKHGLRIPSSHVIVMSDEKSPSFWEEVTERGWRYIDHERENTFALYGEWYVTLLDVVIQSLSLGFVGTDRSTLSVVSQRRVEDWNNGVSRLVLWLP